MKVDRRTLLSAGLGLIGAAGVAGAGGAEAAETTPKTAPASGKSLGLIAMEEACLPRAVLSEWNGVPYPAGTKERLLDITGTRLQEMDACGIDIAVIALTVPGVQAETDPRKAADLAKRANDALAEEISRKPDRFVGFAALSMHDADAACRELERAHRDLGMRGVLLNNFQRTGQGGGDALFYDDRRFDPFWATLERLELPLYLHPGLTPQTGGRERDFEGFDWLKDAAWAFATHTGLHALRIITSGVFDRHPRAQLVLGHHGEHIVYDMWRVDNRIKLRPLGVPATKPVREYFKTNVHVTTSGQFSTPGLQHVINEIGADRVMFAVDYPYEANKPGTDWFHSAPLDPAHRAAIGRNNAARLLKLT